MVEPKPFDIIIHHVDKVKSNVFVGDIVLSENETLCKPLTYAKIAKIEPKIHADKDQNDSFIQ